MNTTRYNRNIINLLTEVEGNVCFVDLRTKMLPEAVSCRQIFILSFSKTHVAVDPVNKCFVVFSQKYEVFCDFVC